jgi:predicted DNA-binding ribbon-helix-helix protein
LPALWKTFGHSASEPDGLRAAAAARTTKAETMTGLIKRSFSLAGHRTSVALETEFWTVLLNLAEKRGQTISALVAAADAAREPNQPLASLLRVMALKAASGDGVQA